jgi:HEAT repeat protein
MSIYRITVLALRHALSMDRTSVLLEALADEEVWVRDEASRALVRMGIAAVPALVGALKDENEIVRWKAAETLGEIGPNAREAVPALVAALQDANPNIRQEAARALDRIG